ncbi:MAG: tetratricopeptide repeat protein [Planctomycetota bacterium]|nr:tetratricopeptide repeat protein [Planctomycetota bacterium]
MTRLSRPAALGLFVAAAWMGGCSEPDPVSAAPSDPNSPPAFLPRSEGLDYVTKAAGSVTFAEDVAPILYENCVPCHRPDGIGPFPFLTYDDVRERGHQIAFVTQTRFMPPWLPAPGYVAFHDERGLTDDEIGTLKQWVEDDMPTGDLSRTPEPPSFASGWLLGAPDRTVTLEEAFTLPAGGTDVFRNFVLPAEGRADRWVRAVEFDVGNSQVVHHATLEVDRSRSSRRLDLEDPLPGYEGMHSEGAQPPDGHFVGWVPGRIPTAGDADQAWQLGKETDLVLQLHMLPSGKPERVRPQIGIHYSDKPPSRLPFMMRLGSRTIDLPAGNPDVRVRDAYRLPVAVTLRAIAPHAHYLGKEMLAWATMPNGNKRWLLKIDDWDFNWQDDYRFKSPLEMPAGTVLHMEYSYDNSVDNPQNPHIPPRHVRFGPGTEDEMGDLWIQMFPQNEDDRAALQNDYLAFDRRREVKRYETLTARVPDDASHWNNLGHFRMQTGAVPEALDAFDRSLALDERYLKARKNRAIALFNLRRPDEAEAELERVLADDDGDADAWATLGRIRGMTGRSDAAAEALERAVAIDAGDPRTWTDLARAARSLGRAGNEVRALERVAELEPGDVATIHRLTRLRATHPDVRNADAALAWCRKGRDGQAGEDPVMLQACASAEAAAGRFAEAERTAVDAARRARSLGAPDVAAKIEAEAALYRSGQPLELRSERR